MIRRAFWLGAGAAAGILGYRRVTAIGRRFSPNARFGPNAGLSLNAGAGPRHTVRGMITFARDVRAGMDIYTSRHALPSGNSTAKNSLSAENRLDRKDGR
jgi:hypothetical protein